MNRFWVGTKPLNKMNAEVGSKTMIYTTRIHIEHADAAALVEGEEVRRYTSQRSRRSL